MRQSSRWTLRVQVMFERRWRRHNGTSFRGYTLRDGGSVITMPSLLSQLHTSHPSQVYLSMDTPRRDVAPGRTSAKRKLRSWSQQAGALALTVFSHRCVSKRQRTASSFEVSRCPRESNKNVNIARKHAMQSVRWLCTALLPPNVPT